MQNSLNILTPSIESAFQDADDFWDGTLGGSLADDDRDEIARSRAERRHRQLKRWRKDQAVEG